MPLSLPEGLTVIDLFRPQNRVQQIAQLISELTETDLADIDAEILKHERQLVGLDAVRQMFRRPAPPPPAVVDLREGPAPKKAPVRKKQALPPPPPPAQEPEEEDWQPPAAEEPAHPLGEDDDHSPLPPAADPPLDEGEGEDEGVVALEPGAEPPPQAAEGVEAKLLWLRKRVVRYIAKMGRAVRSGEIIRGVPLGPRWINRVLDHAWFSQSSQGVHITPQARQAVLDE